MTDQPSLAQFLGTAPAPRAAVRDWTPDEPPSLDGISDVVLNYATDGLEWWKGARPVGATISTLDGQLTRFLPFGFRGGGNLDEGAVKRWAERELRGKKIYNSNTRFDCHQSRVWGVDLEEQGCTFSDIGHTAALLNDHRYRVNLDDLATEYLPGRPTVARLDEKHHASYHAADVATREVYTAQTVGRLREVMYPELDAQDLRAVQNLEDAVIGPVVEMEKNGALLDVELLQKESVEIQQRHDALLLKISKDVGFVFDHTPKSWQRLFEKFGVPLTFLGSGRASFTDDVVADALKTHQHPVLQEARYAAALASLHSKIHKPYLEKVGADGILHFDLNQLRGDDGGTVSGRFSAGYIQQVANHDNHSAMFGDEFFPRRYYIPKPGFDFLDADAAQIEFRIFVHYANNPALTAAYAEDPYMSFHKYYWKKLLVYRPDLSYTHLKSINFMKLYSGGLLKIAVMMGFITAREADEIRANETQRTDPRLATAREINDIYARELPEIGNLIALSSHLAMPHCDPERCYKSSKSRELHRQYKHQGFVRTILKRRSRFPKNFDLHKAFNRVVQGGAADVMKQKLVEVHAARKLTGFLMRMTVHDSVLGDSPCDESTRMVRDLLNQQSFPQLRVPILWETKSGSNWANVKAA